MINAPPPGYFTLRPLRGVEDLAPMLAVADAARSLDSISSGTTLADMKKQYVKSSGFDPERDVVIAESDGQIVGYARGWWLQEGRLANPGLITCGAQSGRFEAKPATGSHVCCSLLSSLKSFCCTPLSRRPSRRTQPTLNWQPNA